jgi:hypothetical protein
LLLQLSGCAVTYAVTGDEMFRPTPSTAPVIRGPNVPEPEPQDEQYDAELKDAAQPQPAAPAAKAASEKKKTDLAKAK